MFSKKCFRALLPLAVGGLVASCVPQAFEQADYRKHLTAAEKQKLAAGQVVDKLHASYWVRQPAQLYWRGPLHVQPLPTGKLRFNPVGHWEQYDEKGGLLVRADYTLFGANSAGYGRMYYPAGKLLMSFQSAPILLNGDSVLVVRLVEFRNGNEQDTVFVEHRYFDKAGRQWRPATRSLDWAGQRPLPTGRKQ
ncbi:MAG: hypothetical protein EOO59_05025 [Hymenobacter sp.]|nr:MAG: hypothetical protein EOO59_05025 [Hymenobacter sp.]